MDMATTNVKIYNMIRVTTHDKPMSFRNKKWLFYDALVLSCAHSLARLVAKGYVYANFLAYHNNKK